MLEKKRFLLKGHSGRSRKNSRDRTWQHFLAGTTCNKINHFPKVGIMHTLDDISFKQKKD